MNKKGNPPPPAGDFPFSVLHHVFFRRVVHDPESHLPGLRHRKLRDARAVEFRGKALFRVETQVVGRGGGVPRVLFLLLFRHFQKSPVLMMPQMREAYAASGKNLPRFSA